MRTLAPSAVVVLMLPLSGCDGSKASAKLAPVAAPAEAVAEADTGPTQIELGNPKGEWRDAAIVKFEIPYRFTSGSPRKVYQCRIEFLGETSGGVKPMEAWELKQEGVIKTGIPANGKVVKEFNVTIYEADAHDKPYHLVSNKVSGEVPPLTPPEPAAESKSALPN